MTLDKGELSTQNQIQVEPDLEGLTKLYEKIETDSLFNGKQVFQIGSMPLPIPFKDIKTNLVLTEAGKNNMSALKRFNNRRGKSIINIIPSNLPGYSLETILTQRSSYLEMRESRISRVAEDLQKSGLAIGEANYPFDPRNFSITLSAGENYHDPLIDTQLKIRLLFPDFLDLKMLEHKSEEPLKTRLYTGLTRLVDSVTFGYELSFYSEVLENCLTAMYRSLATTDHSIALPSINYILRAPTDNVLENQTNLKLSS